MNQLGKVQILVGAFAAFFMLLCRSNTYFSSFHTFIEPLEELIFVLCILPVVKASQALRYKFENLNYSKRAALQSKDYMLMRHCVRRWVYLSLVTVTVLAAVRFNFSVLLSVAVVALFTPIGAIISDHMTGWRNDANV